MFSIVLHNVFRRSFRHGFLSFALHEARCASFECSGTAPKNATGWVLTNHACDVHWRSQCEPQGPASCELAPRHVGASPRSCYERPEWSQPPMLRCALTWPSCIVVPVVVLVVTFELIILTAALVDVSPAFCALVIRFHVAACGRARLNSWRKALGRFWVAIWLRSEFGATVPVEKD